MGKTMLAKISKTAIVIAMSLVISVIAAGPALAKDHHRGGEDWHNHRGYEGRDRDRDRGGFYYAPQPDYYYAPQPNYYYAPEPDYYYAPQPEYESPLSEGINLFFSIR